MEDLEGTLAELLDAMTEDCARCRKLARSEIDKRVARLRELPVATSLTIDDALEILDGVS